MMYVYLIGGWFAFSLIHSLTATQWLKRKLTTRSTKSIRYYRLAYNGLSLATFVPVLILHQKTPIDYLSNWHGSVMIGVMILGAGLIIGVIALTSYDLSEFIGWPESKKRDIKGGFREHGILRYVRHPLYLGMILALFGVLVYQPTWANLIFLLAASLYIRIGIYFEERKLIGEFGELYRHYRRRVPMLVPHWSKTG